MKRFLLLMVVFISTGFALCAQNSLMASYPLTENGNDTTGQNDPMQLRNVVFENGGVYSNGIYYGNDTTGSEILTPPFPVFNYTNFTVQLDFYIDTYTYSREPIIIGGLLWRWIGAYIDEQKLAFMANDFSIYDVTEVTVPDKQWNNLRFSYNQETGICYFYLNHVLVSTYEISEFNSGDDPRFGNSHTGAGQTFYGYWRNLMFFNAASPDGVQEISSLKEIIIRSSDNQLLIIVPQSENGVVLTISDLQSRIIKTTKLSAGSNTIGLSLNTGIYITSFTNPKGERFVKKIKIN